MRLYDEPPWVVDRISQHTGAPPALVRSVTADLHHIVDRLVADDVAVAMSPVVFRRSGEPVIPKVHQRFHVADWSERYGLKALADEHLAKEIGVGPEVLAAFPVAFAWEVLHDLLEWRGLEVEDPSNDIYEQIFGAWRDTLQSPEGVTRRWRSSHVGREKDFEAWLLDRPDVLTDAGYPVQIVERELRLDGGRHRLDMVGRITRDHGHMRLGDLVVIENKATPVGVEAWHQVRRYVQAYEAHADPHGHHVYGLLIADGRSVELQTLMEESGFGYLSLSGLGYRDHLYRRNSLTSEADSSDVTEYTIVVESARPA